MSIDIISRERLKRNITIHDIKLMFDEPIRHHLTNTFLDINNIQVHDRYISIRITLLITIISPFKVMSPKLYRLYELAYKELREYRKEIINIGYITYKDDIISIADSYNYETETIKFSTNIEVIPLTKEAELFEGLLSD
jgi:hypothetical protein